MKKHLFISVLLASLLLSGIAIAVLLIEPLTPDTPFMRIWLPCMVLLLSALIPAAVVSRFSGEIISRRINSIDPKSPESKPTYRELSPLVAKMKNQSGRVAARLRELGLKKAELDEAISHMQEGILIVNHRGDILSHNDRALEILGADPKRSYRSILSLPEDHNLRELLARALGGTRCESERRSDGRFYRMLGSPVKTDAGITGAIILILDETEKEHREALRREFTANISHELKTPLTSISGFAELIASGMATGDDARHFAERIHSEASRLITLVGDIIRLSRLDSGEIPYDTEPIDLGDIVRSTTARLEQIAHDADVSLSVETELLTVRGNRGILEEIVYNLIDNAIKYNRPSGSVSVSLHAESGRPTLRVRDTGIGIPASVQDRIFERFFRADKGRSKAIEGTGLGLSIVKHGAGFHGAEISVDSTEGVGTEMTVRFPQIEKQDTERQRSRPKIDIPDRTE